MSNIDSKVGDNFIATWFYREDKDDCSAYPNVAMSSCSAKFYELYLKSAIDFFVSARLFNPSARLLFFTNIPSAELEEWRVDGVNIRTIFKGLDVRVVNVSLTRKTPADWFSYWRNQFYLLDMLDYFKVELGSADKFILLDSDCVFTNSADPIFDAIEDAGVLNLNIGYSRNEKINGITLDDMREIYSQIYGEKISPEKFFYSGGEFVAMKASLLGSFMSEADSLWSENFERYKRGRIKLNEAAHFLSLLYFRNGKVNDISGKGFIKRMWTFGARNICDGDENTIIWHLPGEKKYGLPRLFSWLKNRDFICGKNDFVKAASSYCMIPKKNFGALAMRYFAALFYKARKVFGRS